MTEISRRGIFGILGAAAAAPLAKPEPVVAKPANETKPEFGTLYADDPFGVTCQAYTAPCFYGVCGVHGSLSDFAVASDDAEEDDGDGFDDWPENDE